MYTHGQLKKLYPNGRIVYAGQVRCPVLHKLKRVSQWTPYWCITSCKRQDCLLFLPVMVVLVFQLVLLVSLQCR